TDVENFLAQAKELVRTAKQNQEEDPKAAQLAVSAYATLHANAEPSFRALFAAQHNIFSSKQAKREGKETSGTIKRFRKYVKKVRDAGERSELTADVKSLEQWNAALAKETNPDTAAQLAEQIDATEQQVFDTLKLLDLDPKALSGNIASADLKSLGKTVENEQTLLATDPRLTSSEQKEAEALLGSLAGSDKEAAEALLVASPDLTKDVLALNDENKALTAIVTELAPNLPAASAENLLESNVELTKDVVALTDTVADVGDVSQTQAAALTVLAESLTNGTVYSPTVAASIEEKIETAVGEITKVLEDETLSEAVLAAQVQVVVDVLKEEVASAVKANDVDTLSRAEAYVDADVKGDGAALNDARFGDIAAAAQDGAFSALETTGAVNLDATVKVAQVGQMGAAIFDNADASIILHDELEGVTTPTIKDIVEAGFAAADVTLSATVLANTQTLTAFLTNEGILPEGVTLSATADIGDTAIILQHIEEHYAQEATAG
ncbi:hypothetical protein HY629_02630, partial [Candidatus Uhrbacteria bacterium]|nr:hypothetical protein [Candidatus Uhrbacteria bacterium]